MADRAGTNLLILAALAGCLVVFDFLPSASSVKEPPAMKMTKIMGPSLRFLYCSNQKQTLVVVAHMLSCSAADICFSVTREDIKRCSSSMPPCCRTNTLTSPSWGTTTHPLPGDNILLRYFLAKILLVICVVSNINIFQHLGLPTPAYWTWLSSNKIYGCLMIFFLSNAIEGQLISTGAFEIQFNDVPVWSKLETGRIPQPPELFQIIDNHIRLDQNPSWSDSI
ncbi:hypothetical protein HAZT_HAZT002004 [Hyalella azteca]|uniref:Selenoprotein T n=1 Tax=Hyalella azteca TaxID=294128 RepID=A0A6A0GWD0_HYAAZ|nr:hypothetical protein HAZT_HAZT002004 [Hyalella azteca]